MTVDVTLKKNFRPGMVVDIETEEDKARDTVTRGVIAQILSKGNQPKGVKVQLTTGEVGRVYGLPSKEEIRMENFKFYNQFFFLPKMYSIWNKTERKYLILDYPTQRGTVEKTAFLFEEKKGAEDLLQLLQLSPKVYMVKEINRKKPISENFKTLEVDVYRLNRDRKLTYERLNELEHYFKNMR